MLKSNYEAMIEAIRRDGYEPTPLEEVKGLGMVPPFQENRPWEERLGQVRGMLQFLRTRPLPRGKRRAKDELELVKALKGLLEMGEKLAQLEPQTVEELNAEAMQRQHFEDLLYAAREDFFAHVEALDEPYAP